MTGASPGQPTVCVCVPSKERAALLAVPTIVNWELQKHPEPLESSAVSETVAPALPPLTLQGPPQESCAVPVIANPVLVRFHTIPRESHIGGKVMFTAESLDSVWITWAILFPSNCGMSPEFTEPVPSADATEANRKAPAKIIIFVNFFITKFLYWYEFMGLASFIELSTLMSQLKASAARLCCDPFENEKVKLLMTRLLFMSAALAE